jgi:hypothetical protein
MSKTTAPQTEAKVAVSKGTKTSEVILGTAAIKLGAGMKALGDMIGEIDKLTAKVNENILIISDQEDKIAAKALELKNAVAQNKIELQQAYESDKEAFVQTWLNENDYEMISTTDLSDLKDELEKAISDTDKEVKREVAIVTNALTSKHAADKREYELTFAAKEAQNIAALSQKDEKIKFLEAQVLSWQTALDKEREASVQRAQAGTVQQTFTNGK